MRIFIVLALTAIAASCAPGAPETDSRAGPGAAGKAAGEANVKTEGTDTIVLGGGCFWCLEAAFELVPGVLDVENGYSGGDRENPTYEQVCTGLTGHAEVVKITYDPSAVSLDRLLDLFWKIHDPTTPNRQGADIGTQYRSIILYASPEQEAAARASLAAASREYRNPIVTEIESLGKYWKAEDYHQDYFRRNPEQGYCRIVVAPKAQKAREWIGQ